MERDILLALEWQMSCPTPMEFVRHLMELLPRNSGKLDESSRRDIVESCRSLVEYTSCDIYFAFSKPSVIGAACLASALAKGKYLAPEERAQLWLHLARVTDLIGVMEAENRLLSRRRHTKIDSSSSTTSSLVRSPAQKNLKLVRKAPNQASPSSSPRCVMQKFTPVE